MTTSKKRSSHSETRKEEHLRILEQLEILPLTDSCCEICHCDCYSSHRSSELNELSPRADVSSGLYKLPAAASSFRVDRGQSIKPDDNNNHKCEKDEEIQNATSVQKAPKVKIKRKKSASSSKINLIQSHDSLNSKSAKSTPTCKSPGPSSTHGPGSLKSKKRSKSASSMHSQESRASIHTTNMRDCKILQELLTSLEDTPRLEIQGKNRKSLARGSKNLPSQNTKSSWPSLLDKSTAVSESKSTLSPLKLCESMATLCLSPTVRQAFRKVPLHDKKILNRMAIKRSEGATATENAWLARKYWENERYERELLKCEEMEEYKKAVRDKQFQDYLLTKARINEIAQRDLEELQRLRESLQYKDERAKRRIEAVRMERDILQCQRRCDELRKSEAVNIHQEEHNLDAALRKQEICQRLTERLQRAEHIRTQMLESYLKRVRYDNYIEQLLHEEKWREAQKLELQRREQLKEHITLKRKKSQRFVDSRMRRNEAITKTAKISASLRELVRSSVTPEGAGATAGNFSGAAPLSLGRLLFDRPISKLSIK